MAGISRTSVTIEIYTPHESIHGMLRSQTAAYTCYGLHEPEFFNHIIQSYVLDEDDIVMSNQISGRLVHHIFSMVGDILMRSYDLSPAFSRRLFPFVFRESLHWRLASFFCLFARYLWLECSLPFKSTAKDLTHKSKPTANPEAGLRFL